MTAADEPPPGKPSSDPPAPAYEGPDEDRPASGAAAQTVVLDDGRAGRKHDPYAALRIPNYLKYVAAFFVAVIGGQVLFVSVGYDLYQRTGSSMTLAWVGFVLAMPNFVLSLPAGQLADRFDRKRIMMIAQGAAAACAVGLAAMSHYHAPLWAIYAMLCLTRSCGVMGWPARAALMPQIVPQHVFANAAAWNTSIFTVAAALGPAVAGFILIYGAVAAYLLTAACWVAYVVVMATVRTGGPPKRTEPATLKTLVAGVRFVFATHIILATITLDLFAVLFGGAEYLLPVFADEILHIGPVKFGWLRAAPAIGAFAMALVVAHLPPFKRAGWTLLWAVAGFGLTSLIFGLSKWYWLSFAMLALNGALDNISVVVRHTLVQVLTPDHMRGRVNAVNQIFIGASNEIGGFESGVTSHWWGPVRAVVVGGLGTLAVVALVAIGWPKVRKLGSLQDLKPEAV